MPNQKSGNFDQGAYVAGYMREKIKLVKVSLNRTKPEDIQIMEWLDNRPEGASGYIKRLIREDMERSKLP